MSRPDFAFHLENRDRWTKIDALKLKKELKKAHFEAEPWFVGSPRAAAKLTIKHPKGAELLASTDLAEMASRSEVAMARYEQLLQDELRGGAPVGLDDPERKGFKLNNLSIKTASFPACGAGLDLFHFVEFCRQHSDNDHPKLIAGDLEPLHTDIAKHNAEILHIPCHFYTHDALQPEPVDTTRHYVFMDPARREGSTSLERYEYRPALDDAIEHLERYDLAQIKLAPGESPERLEIYSLRGWHWHWIQHGKDLLECAGTWVNPKLRPKTESSTEPEHQRRATRILHGRRESWSPSSSEHQVPRLHLKAVPEQGRILIQASKALGQAKLESRWALEQQLKACAYDDLWLSETSCPEKTHWPLGDAFTLEDAFLAHPKQIKQQLKKREPFPYELRSTLQRTPPELQKKIEPHLKNKGDPKERRVLMLCQRDEKPWLLILKPIVSFAESSTALP